MGQSITAGTVSDRATSKRWAVGAPPMVTIPAASHSNGEKFANGYWVTMMSRGRMCPVSLELSTQTKRPAPMPPTLG